MEEKEIEESQHKHYKRIRIVIQAFLLLIILGLCIWAIVYLFPLFMRLQSDEIYRNEILAKLESFGSFSWVLLIGAQILQTVLAVIPSGPIVIISGMMYPPAISVIICLVGQTLGALLVILLVKAFGYSFLALFVDPKQTKKFKLLNDGKRCAVLMFSYLLIPVLPKDPVTFIVPFTKVKTSWFLLLNLVARTPMTIVSVVFGNSLISGNYWLGIALGAISAVLAALCFILNKKIVAFIDKMAAKKTAKNTSS